MSLYTYSAKLDRVVDGDTVDLTVDLGFGVHKQDRFRLYGINAPEVHGDTKELGIAATAHLIELLGDKPLTVKTHKDDTDKYGRMLAEIVAGDVNVNDRMIADGHAVAYFGGKR